MVGRPIERGDYVRVRPVIGDDLMSSQMLAV